MAVGSAIRNPDIRRVELAWGAAIAAEWAHFVAFGVFAYEEGGVSAVGIAGLVRLLPANARIVEGSVRRSSPRSRLRWVIAFPASGSCLR